MKTITGLTAYLLLDTLLCIGLLYAGNTIFPTHPVTVAITFALVWIASGYLAVADYLNFSQSEKRAHRALAKALEGE